MPVNRIVFAFSVDCGECGFGMLVVTLSLAPLWSCCGQVLVDGWSDVLRHVLDWPVLTRRQHGLRSVSSRVLRCRGGHDDVLGVCGGTVQPVAVSIVMPDV